MASSVSQIAYDDRLRVLIIASAADIDAGAARSAMWRLAQALSRMHDVILAFPGHTGAQHADFAVIYYNQRNIALLARDSDVVIMSGSVVELNPELRGLGETAPAAAEELAKGDLSEGSLSRAAVEGEPSGPNTTDAGLLVLWPDQTAAGGAGFGHYWRRLKHHLRQGGLKRVASQGGALIKRKIRSGRNP